MNCPWTRGLKEDPAVGPGLAGVSPLRPGRGPFRPDGTHRTVRAPGSLPAGAHTCADRPAAGGKVVDFALSLLVYLSHGAHVSLKASISSHVQSTRVSSKCSLHAEQGLSEEPRVGPARCPRAASVSRHARTGPKSKGTTSLTGPQLLGETCPRWRGGCTVRSWVTGPHTSVCGLGWGKTPALFTPVWGPGAARGLAWGTGGLKVPRVSSERLNSQWC